MKKLPNTSVRTWKVQSDILFINSIEAYTPNDVFRISAIGIDNRIANSK